MNTITQQILEDLAKLPPQMQEEALDFVRYLNEKIAKRDAVPIKKETNGKEVAEIMVEIARRGSAFQDLTDPVMWQRETRKDRPLPGREK
jgi:hypothetical protein